MASAAGNVHDHVVHEALNEARLVHHAKPLFLPLLTVQVVLAPLVDATLLGEAERVVGSTLDLRHLQTLLEERRRHNKVLL